MLTIIIIRVSRPNNEKLSKYRKRRTPCPVQRTHTVRWVNALFSIIVIPLFEAGPDDQQFHRDEVISRLCFPDTPNPVIVVDAVRDDHDSAYNIVFMYIYMTAFVFDEFRKNRTCHLTTTDLCQETCIGQRTRTAAGHRRTKKNHKRVTRTTATANGLTAARCTGGRGGGRTSAARQATRAEPRRRSPTIRPAGVPGPAPRRRGPVVPFAGHIDRAGRPTAPAAR